MYHHVWLFLREFSRYKFRTPHSLQMSFWESTVFPYCLFLLCHFYWRAMNNSLFMPGRALTIGRRMIPLMTRLMKQWVYWCHWKALTLLTRTWATDSKLKDLLKNPDACGNESAMMHLWRFCPILKRVSFSPNVATAFMTKGRCLMNLRASRVSWVL